MRRLVLLVLCAAVLGGVSGCASQCIIQQEFYEPNPDTIHKRADGHTVGALKSETTKSGQPDWSPKAISLISVGGK